MPTTRPKPMPGNKSFPELKELNLPDMLKHQADDAIVVGPDDITRIPAFLQKQAGIVGMYSGEAIEQKKIVSELLSKNKIPGIKYLDQASRDIGKGTSNYVVFDAEKAKIIADQK